MTLEELVVEMFSFHLLLTSYSSIINSNNIFYETERLMFSWLMRKFEKRMARLISQVVSQVTGARG